MNVEYITEKNKKRNGTQMHLDGVFKLRTTRLHTCHLSWFYEYVFFFRLTCRKDHMTAIFHDVSNNIVRRNFVNYGPIMDFRCSLKLPRLVVVPSTQSHVLRLGLPRCSFRDVTTDSM